MAGTRIVDLPFVYRADCVARGRRNSSERNVRDTGSFAVATPAEEEAPVAFEVVRVDDWEERRSRAGKAGSETVGDRARRLRGLPARKVPKAPDVIRLRTWEGRVLAAVGAGRGATLGVEEFVRGANEPPRDLGILSTDDGGLNPEDLPVLPVMASRGYRRDETMRVPDLPDVLASVAGEAGKFSDRRAFLGPNPSVAARVKSHDREVRLAEAAKCYAESLAFVGDEAWSTSGAYEPFYAVEVGRDRREVRVRLVVAEFRSATMSPFRLDRREEAMAFGAATAKGLGYDFRPTGDEARILDAGAVRRDDVRMLAECLLRHPLVVNDEEWGDDLWRAYCDLGRIKADFESAPEADRDGAWTAEVFEAASRAYAEARKTDCIVAKSLEIALETAVTRWETVERERRPDLAGREEEERALGLGF